MKASMDFGRWATGKTAVVAGLLAIGGIVGSALAMSPVISPPIRWQGGWEANIDNTEGGVPFYQLYQVPAGRSLMITDLIVSNFTAGESSFNISTKPGDGACEAFLVPGTTRLQTTFVPAKGITNIAFQTGLGVGAGQKICVNLSTDGTRLHARGFLFTPQP